MPARFASGALRAHYARLGLRGGKYTRAEVAAAYRAAALRTHPDRGGCRHAFARLTVSYEAALAVADGGARVYAPSSLRFHANSGGGGRSDENARLMAALVIPVAALAAVSVRLVYASRDTPELRAGGSSRVSAAQARAHERVRAANRRGGTSEEDTSGDAKRTRGGEPS